MVAEWLMMALWDGQNMVGWQALLLFFFFFLFLNLDTSFSSKDRKNHSHDVKETWNYSVRMHDCRMIGGYYRLLACTDKSKGEEKETAYIYILIPRRWWNEELVFLVFSWITTKVY